MLLSFVFLASAVFVGTAGYMYIEKWDVITSLYMTTITLSTVGYGVPRSLNTLGYIFTMILIAFGISVYLYAIGTVAAFFLDGDLRKYLSWRRVTRRIEKMKNHCVIVGGGEIGKYVALELTQRVYPYVFITDKEDVVDDVKGDIKKIAKENDFYYIIGDLTDEETLEKAGVREAKTLVTTLSDDSLNVYIALMAKSMNRTIEIISEASDIEAIKRLNYAGVDRVISSTEIVGSRMAALVMNPGLQSFMDVIHRSGNTELRTEEIFVNIKSPFAGKTLKEAEIPQKTGLLVIAVQKGNDFVFNPSASTVIDPGASIIVLGKNEEQIRKLRDLIEA